MHIETVETPCLGNRSYVVVVDKQAVVVDPPRDVERIEDVVARHDADITHVLETHRHADYVSGGLVLARRHRAPTSYRRASRSRPSRSPRPSTALSTAPAGWGCACSARRATPRTTS